MGVNHITSNAPPKQAQIHIMTDSYLAYGTFELFWRSKTYPEIVKAIRNAITNSSKTNPITIHWIAGHAGIPGNDAADHYATIAASNSTHNPADTTQIARDISTPPTTTSTNNNNTNTTNKTTSTSDTATTTTNITNTTLDNNATTLTTIIDSSTNTTNFNSNNTHGLMAADKRSTHQCNRQTLVFNNIRADNSANTCTGINSIFFNNSNVNNTLVGYNRGGVGM